MPAASHGHGHGHGHAGSSSAGSPTASSSAAALPNHQLGELIGRGAFGAVYRALNWQTGETVAVKQIALGNIPPSELPDIMTEIDLLKNLNHPNVVQYRGFVKTGDFLWIVLEYCENGSLTAICKKFGKFPESLCQIYICQVLEGLLYLHEQGVIHRDIKGSNILATKEGSIKLADFGVATRVGGLDRSVVGSPYWMAPEVVEQSGATTASDIWSVGCVVIELLEGQPPYHDLEPMPALFRIVNDDCPPLPDSASPVVRDFLLQCFQKDSNLRISARKLLKHPWMVSARKQLDLTKHRLASSTSLANLASDSKINSVNSSNSNNRRPSSRNAYDETVQKVQEWNNALDKQQQQLQPPPLSTLSLSQHIPLATKGAATNRLSEDVASALQQAPGLPPTTVASKAGRQLFSEVVKSPRGKHLPLASASRIPHSSARSVAQGRSSAGSALHFADEDKENDNWDSDFLDGIPNAKLAPIESTSASQVVSQGETKSDEFASDNGDTIRPGAFSPGFSQQQKAPPKALPTVSEDYSDMLSDNETKPFEGKVKHLRKASGSQKPILHPCDLSSGSHRPPNVSINTQRSSSAAIRGPPLPTISTPPPAAASNRPRTPSVEASFERFGESENEDYSDAFDDKIASKGKNGQRLELTKKLSSKSWLGDDDLDEEDPFAEVEQNLSEDEQSDSLEANVQRDKIARMCAFVNDLLDGMSAEADELAIRDGCIYLIENFDQAPEVKLHLIRSHGLLTIVESLQTVQSRDVIGLELRIVNLLIADNPDYIEKICLIGGCPVIMRFSHSRYSRDIRLEAALFIGAMCRTSLLTLQMFISCRGLRTLIDMMDENYQDQKDLVWMAVDGICRIFDMQGSTPRNDFCRMFAKEGLLEPLSSALLAVAQDDDDLAQSALHKIAHILLLLAQSDLKVKTELAQRAIALRLVRSLSLLPQDLLPMLLKTIKNISMAPAALDILQNANAIEALVGTLTRYLDVTEICNPVVNALYNMCRLSRSRQEEAALAGAVPPLQKLVASNSPLKQFALPIVCDFAHASKTCRKILWQHDVFDLYIDLLSDPFWNLSALESILSWLQDETSRVEDALLEDSATEAILKTFSKAKATSFENILEPLLKILRISPNLCNKLSTHASLYRRLLERLSTHPKAVVRLNLLRLVRTFFEAAVVPSRVVKQPTLVATINRLAEDDPSLLVKNYAKDLLKDFSEAEKRSKSNRILGSAFGPGTSSSAFLNGSSSSPSAAKMNRTRSESAMNQILGLSNSASPRYKVKPRPHSPSLQVPPSPSSSSSQSIASNLSPGNTVPVVSSTSGSVQGSARRIILRAKTSPTR